MEKDKDEVKYIQMAYDNITQLVELVESYRDTINSVRDLYIAYISLQMNDTICMHACWPVVSRVLQSPIFFLKFVTF
jgi:magnesium transporter